MCRSSLIFSILILSVLLVTADLPTPFEIKRLMLINFASWCGNGGITAEWDCYPCKKPELQGFVLDGKVLNVTSVMFAFMGHIDGTFYIVIRGTVPNSLTSWIMNDLRLWLEDWPARFDLTRKPKVARGFQYAWESIAPGVLSMMRNARYFCPTCTRAVITGHSLGAAIAPLAALFAAEYMGLPKQSVILMASGGPRIGNLDFAREVQDSVGESYRVVYGADIVTQTPLKILGYHHYAQELWFKKDGSLRVCDRFNGEDDTCSNSNPAAKYLSDDHIAFNGVLTPQLILDMLKSESMDRWCGGSHMNERGIIGAFFAEADLDENPAELEPGQWTSEQIRQGLEMQYQATLANLETQTPNANLETSGTLAIALFLTGCAISLIMLIAIIIRLTRSQ